MPTLRDSSKSQPAQGLGSELAGGLNAAASTLAITLASATLILAPLGIDALPLAFVMCLVAAIAGGLVAALLSSTPIAISAPRAAVSIVVAAFAARVAQAVPNAGAADIVAMVGLAVLGAGIIQWAAGWIGLGQLVRFVPFPVIAGFTHGIAITLLAAYVPLMLGLADTARIGWPEDLRPSPGALLLGLVTLAAVFGFAKVVRKAPSVFLALVVGLAVAWALNAWLPQLDPGAVLPIRGLPPPVLPLTHAGALDTVIAALGWPTLVAFAFAIATVSSLDALIGITAIETRYALRSNADRDLVSQGAGNLLSGLLGGTALTYGAVQVQAAYAVGARRRLAGVISAPIVALIAVLGALAIERIPLAVLAALMVFFAVRIADPWGWALWRRVLTADRRDRESVLAFAVYLGVTLSIVTLDIVATVAIGVLVSAIFFVHTMNRHVVRRTLTGPPVRSRRLHPPAIEERLDKLMRGAAVVEVQGPLFFGTADRIVAEVHKLPAPVRFVVIDLHRVQALDATASVVLSRLRTRMAADGREVLLSGAPEGLDSLDGLLPPVFPDRDRAAEWIEDRLLTTEGIDPAPVELPPTAFAEFIGAGPAEVEALMRYSTVRELSAQEAVFRFGEASNALFFLLSGRVTIQYGSERGNIRVVTLLPGNVFGHVAFVDGQPRSADAICDVPGRMVVLGRSALARMEQDDPGLASRLHAMAARDIASRLRATDRIVREML